MTRELVLYQMHVLLLALELFKLALLLMDVVDLGQFLLFELVNDLILQILLRQNDVLEVLVDVVSVGWRYVRSPVLVEETWTRTLPPDVESAAHEWILLVVFALGVLPSDLPTCKTANPLIGEGAVQPLPRNV